MLWTWIDDFGARTGDRLAIVQGSRHATYGELAALVHKQVGYLRAFAARRVGLAISDPIDFVVTMCALGRIGAHTFLAGPRPADELRRLRDRLEWDEVIHDLVKVPCEPKDLGSTSVQHSFITILTSGTSGEPKSVNHTWESLAAHVRRDSRFLDTRWLLAYSPHLYAGLQVLLQAVGNGGMLVIPESNDVNQIIRCLRDHRVTHASGTPTFWRQLLTFGSEKDLHAVPLRQITLGGEVVPQDLLNRLAHTFLSARIVHIYASTELGRLFTVTDGREGFPRSYLDAPPECGVSIRVVDGRLEARSVNAMKGYQDQALELTPDGYLRTDDLVEIHDDRVIFVGRETEIINVGGAKVAPQKVERVLAAVPGVAHVCVYSWRSSLAGEVVVADVVAAPGFAATAVREAVQSAAREQLLPHERPRLLQMVDEIPVGPSRKTLRKVHR